jgi:hypothetical protein
MSDLAALLQAERRRAIDSMVANQVSNVLYNYEHNDGRPGLALEAIQRVFEPYRKEYGL